MKGQVFNTKNPYIFMEKLFDGVFLFGKYMATKNLVPGMRVYDERLVKEAGIEYRMWEPHRSKLAAAVKKRLQTFPFKEGVSVLYLGASTGTTVSHVSDIIGKKGVVYAVESSAHVMKHLIKNCEKRENVVPILADANKPGEYEEIGEVDVLYQDVAQPNQDEILIKNAQRFLNAGGIAMLAIKSQSIDVLKTPDAVFAIVLSKLEPYFEILEKFKLEPFDKDHLFVVLRKK